MAVCFLIQLTRAFRTQKGIPTQIDYVQKTYLRLKTKCVLLFCVPLADNVSQLEFQQ